MPHVLLSEINNLAMLRALKGGRYLSMAFRLIYTSFLIEHNQLWAIKMATQLEKSRYIIFVLQSGRKKVMSENISRYIFNDNVEMHLDL